MKGVAFVVLHQILYIFQKDYWWLEYGSYIDYFKEQLTSWIRKTLRLPANRERLTRKTSN